MAIAEFQYHKNRATAKISTLSSRKIDKYEYLKGEEILLSQQHRLIEGVKICYVPLLKACENQTKTIEKHRARQVEAFKCLETSNKEIPSTKNLILERNLNFLIWKGYKNM